jgi:hypothetical protein
MKKKAYVSLSHHFPDPTADPIVSKSEPFRALVSCFPVKVEGTLRGTEAWAKAN